MKNAQLLSAAFLPDCSIEFLASGRESAQVGVGHAKILSRIDRNVFDANFVVEVGTGAATAIADKPDRVTAVYTLAREHGKGFQMAVTCADPVAVVNDDRSSITAHEVGKLNHAVCR